MNEIYRAIGTTKQNVHNRLNFYLRRKEEEGLLLEVIRQARIDHPAMGADSLYKMLKLRFIGRDRFRQWYNENGYKIHQLKNFRKTTDSSGVIRFPNLIENQELNGVNQILVSDITYYEIDNRWYYLTFIMDLCSRKIKGFSASKTLKTSETTTPALQMALKGLSREQTEGMIFHSDGGGQYYCKDLIKYTNKMGIKNSMCSSVYENSHAERVNGTIKNSYLKHYTPKDFKELTQMLKKAVYMYNHQKPHVALNDLSPVQFEKLLLSYPQNSKLLTKKKEAKKKSYNNNISNITT